MEIKIIRDEDLQDGLLKPGTTSEGITWLFARGGCFVRKENPLYSATVKVDPPSILGDLKESWAIHVPKLPLVLFRQIEAFFAEVYKRYKSEAVIVLYACPDRGWRAECPVQEVSSASVNYKRDQIPTIVKDGEWEYTLFGSIHSHASMTAFHSGTDDRDEMNFDGLHITVGGLDKDEHSYACRMVLHGKPIKVDLGDVVDGFRLAVSPPTPWLLRVTERSFISSVPAVQGGNRGWQNWIGNSQGGYAGAEGGDSSEHSPGKPDKPVVQVLRTSPKRVSRKEAEYANKGESMQCWGCINFKGGKKCAAVHGDIAIDGCCNLFDPRPGFRTAAEMSSIDMMEDY